VKKMHKLVILNHHGFWKTRVFTSFRRDSSYLASHQNLKYFPESDHIFRRVFF
jgi:hypothetical protein